MKLTNVNLKSNGLSVLVFLFYFILVIALLWYIFHYKEGNEDILTNPQKDLQSINNYLTEQSTNALTSAISPGISTIDRYADPMCKQNEYIYCVDGYIECDDIFGTSQNALQNMAPYTSGSTLAGCGTYINKINLSDYTTDYRDVSYNHSRGVYFDLSQCDTLNYPGKPWKVGGDTTMTFQGCYPSQTQANNAWDALNGIMNINTTEIYKNGDNILIQDTFLRSVQQTLQSSDTQTSLNQILAILDADKNNKLYKMVNNTKYYKGTIKDASTALYTVSLGIPGYAIDIPGVSNQYLLKDSLYNKFANDYYSDLGAGSHTRPVCKSGTFTSCLANPPFIMKNGKYVPTSDSMIQVYPDISHSVDTGAPFKSPLSGPSVDEPSSLLEYNYFKTSNSDSPFIQCIADYGTKIGDNLCCGQKGTLQDTKHVCPAESPTCQGYSKDNYGYCA